ncbi:DUF4236 domain-containing protein [bacterium]|nr:DUF4236 domain-containing protein [bacterium]
MGLRFRKSISIGKLFRVNFSKSGIGYSFGIPGARISRSAKGDVKTTYSIPGTGISYTPDKPKNKTAKKKTNVDQESETMRMVKQIMFFILMLAIAYVAKNYLHLF